MTVLAASDWQQRSTSHLPVKVEQERIAAEIRRKQAEDPLPTRNQGLRAGIQLRSIEAAVFPKVGESAVEP